MKKKQHTASDEKEKYVVLEIVNCYQSTATNNSISVFNNKFVNCS